MMKETDVYPRESTPCIWESRQVEVRPDGSVRVKVGHWVWIETLVNDAAVPQPPGPED